MLKMVPMDTLTSMLLEPSSGSMATTYLPPFETGLSNTMCSRSCFLWTLWREMIRTGRSTSYKESEANTLWENEVARQRQCWDRSNTEEGDFLFQTVERLVTGDERHVQVCCSCGDDAVR